MNYTQTIKTKHQKLHDVLRELDRLVHCSQALLYRTDIGSATPKINLWQTAHALWKGKIKEDPLQYQRRIRSEE